MKKEINNSPINIRRALLGTLIMILSVVGFQACDDDDDDPTAPTEDNIVEVAQSDSNFSTLVAALEGAGLTTTLEGEGPFTVFAPTNAAFESLPDGLLDSLSNEQLVQILNYHVVANNIGSDDLEAEQTVQAASGDELFITSNGEVNINDSSTVVSADIEASNGVIHSIDQVLFPDNFLDVFNIIDKRYSLSALEGAIQDADLVSTLQQDTEDGYTIFAPDNAAFDNLPEDTLDQLSQPELQDLLTYHVLSNTVLSTDLADSQKVEAVNGDSLVIEVIDGTVTLTDNNGNSYNVTIADLEGTNGVVHIIDGVLEDGE